MKAIKIVLFIVSFYAMAVLCVLGPEAESSGNLPNPTLRLIRTGFHQSILDRSDPVRGLSISTGDVPDNVLAIRVDFPEDTTSTTTGTGKFDLSTGSDETINPSPHDRLYFERQMEALRNYYANVSRGQLDFSYLIYPLDEQGAYTLPHEMAYYYPNITEEENDRRLAEFFRDALEAADAAGTIDFSQFDAVVIFHAGVGADISFAIDETPNDIPSAYIDLDWLVRSLGSEYAQGVAVNGGSHHIPEGLWMPETLNQQDIEFGLTGPLAKLFGHRLGLPNLYNSLDGSSGIGAWGLMDQGSGNELGLIPPQPNATILKVPINAEEYFLIENRQRDALGDGLMTQGAGGVLLEVDEYDWGIPGSGLLIWHVDEKVIEEHYATNTVNADPYHRGVDLEEADGFQDIGFIIYGGFVTYGSPEDAFYQGNNTAFTPNTEPGSESYSGADSHIFVTEIGPSGATMTCDVSNDIHQPGWPDSVGVSLADNPPLVGDLDGDGDIEIVVNSLDGRVFAWNHDGKPFLPGADSSALFVQLADSAVGSAALGNLDWNQDLGMALGDVTGKVHAWNNRGEEIIGFPYNLDHPISSAAIVSPIIPTGLQSGILIYRTAEIVVGTSDGWVYGLGLFGFTPGMMWNLGTFWEINLDDAKIKALAIAENTPWPETYLVAAGTVDGHVAWWYPYAEGTIEPMVVQTSSDVVGLATGDLDRDNEVEVIAVCAGGDVYAWNLDGSPLSGWPVETGGPLKSSPALGDIDDDGYLEVVVSGTDQIWAWNYNGSPQTNFPISLGTMGTLRSSPVLGDVNQDGAVDIVLGTPQGLLVAYDRFGGPLEGWPLACVGAVEASPTLADIDGDGDIELLTSDEDGWMYVWDLAAEPDSAQLPWPTWGHDFRHTGGFPNSQLPPLPPAGELMPRASVYNYPNPTEGQNTTIRYTIGQEADVNIRIYDLSGDLVAELPGTGFAHTENEIVWDLSQIASGIYLCRVEAKGASGGETAFCKIAVVK